MTYLDLVSTWSTTTVLFHDEFVVLCVLFCNDWALIATREKALINDHDYDYDYDDGTKRAGTRSDGRKQGRNSADGCGEDRASHVRQREGARWR